MLRLPKEFVLDLLGIDISATRMKCAMLGLKVVKSASLGEAAEWEDEGEQGDPAEAAADLCWGVGGARGPSSRGSGWITAKIAPNGSLITASVPTSFIFCGPKRTSPPASIRLLRASASASSTAK